MTETADVIHCRHACRSFRNHDRSEIRAVDDVSFDLSGGRIAGVLGPDGAGKTTLLRMLTGLLKADRGEISVLGCQLPQEADALQCQVGYMPQKFGLYEDLSVEENLRLYAELHGVPVADQKIRFAELLNMTMLTRFSSRMAGKLSGGMKQKLALACALVSRPQLLILDEPTVGVDVLSRRELWQILRQLADREAISILVSTAYLDEADHCDELLILHRGRLLLQTTPDGLRQMAAAATPQPRCEDGFQILLAGGILPRLARRHPCPPDAPVAVEARHLIKRFGSFTAVNDLDFNVRRGEIFGLLGANGAGKTTTFRMLCGLSACDGGSVRIAGTDLRAAGSEARRKIGFVAQKFSLYGDLSVFDNLRFFSGAYGLSGNRRRERIDWAINTFELGDLAAQPAARIPAGFKQRLGMACALLHEPEILFLDGATSGADPLARHEFWQRIMELADRGIAVIITTHFLDEAEYCDHMVIMQDGIAAASGTLPEILQRGNSPILEEAFVNIIRNFRQEHPVP